MTDNSPLRVILVDDDQAIHAAIHVLLRSVDDIALVGEAYRGDDALPLCQQTQPDVVLMDVVMPGQDGAETTRDLLAAFPDLKVLVLSGFRDYEYIKATLDAGAMGYVVKDAMVDELLATLRATQQGSRVFSPDVAQAILSPPDTSPDDFGLTEREMEVLEQMARGFTYQDAADALGISERTIRFHLTNIQGKFGVETRSEALVVAARHGLVK